MLEGTGIIMDDVQYNRDRVPCSLSLPRAWKWCVMATMRDLRESAARGYAISLPNLRRLFVRRWTDTCYLHDLRMDSPKAMELCAVGRRYVAERYGKELSRAWGIDDARGRAA